MSIITAREQVELLEVEIYELRRNITELSNAWVDLYNISGHDGHVKHYYSKIEELAREYSD